MEGVAFMVRVVNWKRASVHSMHCQLHKPPFITPIFVSVSVSLSILLPCMALDFCIFQWSRFDLLIDSFASASGLLYFPFRFDLSLLSIFIFSLCVFDGDFPAIPVSVSLCLAILFSRRLHNVCGVSKNRARSSALWRSFSSRFRVWFFFSSFFLSRFAPLEYLWCEGMITFVVNNHGSFGIYYFFSAISSHSPLSCSLFFFFFFFLYITHSLFLFPYLQ